jgi:hypothetical protein
MFVHPGDGAIWALYSSGQVVRIRGDVCERIADEEPVAIPEARRVLLCKNQVARGFTASRPGRGGRGG